MRRHELKQPVVIIQAGGRGSRLRHHTWNKPKALVSVGGRPILYNAFETFPDARFIVIGDYRIDVIQSYLNVVKPDVPVTVIKASGKGTMAGIADALKLVDNDVPIMLLWSDIVFSNHPLMPYPNKTTICVTNDFLCRWNYDSELGVLLETPSATNGVMGCFYFTNKSDLDSIPSEGEFVRWISKANIDFDIKCIQNVKEIGDFKTLEETNDREGFCRFFNEVHVTETEVTKRVIDPQYQTVHKREMEWYEEVSSLGFSKIPKLKSKNPLVMERITGSHAYQLNSLSNDDKNQVINNYFDTLNELHSLKVGAADLDALREVYIDKTVSRVFEISHLIPHFSKDTLTINGLKVKNIFSERFNNVLDEIFNFIEVRDFKSIHGDCTFSNTIVSESYEISLIDPRGYFSKPGILGDPNYDFAKLYYSAIGGYDLFNRRAFKLHFDDETAEIMMPDPIFREQSVNIYQERFSDSRLKSIEVAHALIWLSLSGYAKDDYDSAIGAFYLGLYWMERALK